MLKTGRKINPRYPIFTPVILPDFEIGDDRYQ
jgi:hypothetical protein